MIVMIFLTRNGQNDGLTIKTKDGIFSFLFLLYLHCFYFYW